MNQAKLAPGGKPTYTQKMQALFSGRLVGYWPLSDTSGTTATDVSGNGRNGAYAGTVTKGEAGIGDGLTSVKVAGSGGVVNVYSAGLAAAWPGQEGGIMLWAKAANAGVWTDATLRRIWTVFVDGSNATRALKTATNNTWSVLYSAQASARDFPATLSTTAWFHMAMTWSKTNDRAKLYVNGVQVGSTLASIGTWAGTPSVMTFLAGDTTPNQVWNGWGAHAAIISGEPSAAEILKAATV